MGDGTISQSRHAARRKRKKRAQMIAGVAALLAGGVCAILFRDNISKLGFLAAAAFGLTCALDAFFGFMHRKWPLAAAAVFCLALACAAQCLYTSVDGHAYQTFATALDVRADSLTTLSGVERCGLLRELDARDLGLSDVSPVAALRSLQKADLRGNPISESSFDALRAAQPDADIVWSVPVGATRFDSDSASLTLAEENFVTASTLARQLAYFTDLTELDLTACPLNIADMAVVAAAIPNTHVVWNVPAGGSECRSDAETVAFSGALTADELLPALPWLKNMQTLDLRACEMSRADVEAAVAAAPGVQVEWRYEFEGAVYASDMTELTLSGVRVSDAEDLAAILAAMPALEKVDLSGASISNDNLYFLADSFPNLDLAYKLNLYGALVSSSATYIDLSQTDADEPSILMRALGYLPNLREAELGSCGLTYAEMASIQDAYPDVSVVWEMELYGTSVRTDATSLSFANCYVSSLAPIADALPYMKKLTYLDLSGAGASNENLASLRDEYPNVNIVWTVRVGSWVLRTDATAFSTLQSTTNKFRLGSADFDNLRYVTGLLALDLGHNQVTTLSFIEPLTKLRVLILADNRVSDISVLSNMPDLQYVELFMNQLTDISPLASCPNLIDLNLCYNYIKDVSPICKLTKLQRLWMSGNGVSYDKRSTIQNAIPACHCDFDVDSSTGDGWREHDRYDVIKEMFDTGEYIPFAE